MTHSFALLQSAYRDVNNFETQTTYTSITSDPPTAANTHFNLGPKTQGRSHTHSGGQGTAKEQLIEMYNKQKHFYFD